MPMDKQAVRKEGKGEEREKKQNNIGIQEGVRRVAQRKNEGRKYIQMTESLGLGKVKKNTYLARLQSFVYRIRDVHVYNELF